MKSPAFEYACPATLEDAIQLLVEREGNAKIIAGGQSLVPLLAFRLAAPDLLVDLKRIPDLDSIEINEYGTRLGGKVRWCDIERDQRLADAQPLLADAVSHIAHYHIRNRGTVGGSLAHADPSAELPGIAVTCDASITLVGKAGLRVVDASQFFTGSLETMLLPDEIITKLHLPPWRPKRRWAFLEFARRKGDFALVAVALFYDLEEDGTAANAHVGAIGVADRPIRIGAAEEALNGRPIVAATIENVSNVAAQAVDPATDVHAPSNYRRALLVTLLQRALRKSSERGV